MTANPKPCLPPTESEDKPFSLLSDQKLIEIYTVMLRCRLLAGRSSGRAVSGREAVLAGVLVDLVDGDALAAARPDLLALLALGLPLKTLIRKLTANNFAAAMRSLCSSAQEALDEARACKQRKQSELVVVLLPAGWAAQAEWTRAMAIAWKRTLPILFVTEGAEPGFVPEFPVIPVDTHDAVALYRVATEAMVRARNGGWPTLIECIPFVLEGQRAPRAVDPLARMEQYLRGKQLFAPRLKRQIAAEFDQEQAAAGVLRA